jgi:uncharacterized protein
MKSPIISDSTCLIGLERIQELEILPGLFEPIVIPQQVHREFGVTMPWLHVETPLNTALVTSLKLVVDDGEAEAIALAYEKGRRIILDGRHARKAAQGLGVTMIGTVGVLVQARQQGLIPRLKPLIEKLAKNNFYISDELKEETLALVGE